MNIENIIPPLAAALGVNPVTALAVMLVVGAIANLTGRLIPDDKKGILGLLRGAAKIVGLYSPNRITAGISVNDVARSVIGAQNESLAEQHLVELAAEAGSLIPEVDEYLNKMDAVVPPFPDHPARDSGGKFAKKVS